MSVTNSLSQIGQIAITVENTARATAFYRDILGLPFLFAAGDMAFFDCDGVRLMLAEPETHQEGKISNSILYFRVTDINASYQALSARGANFEDQPHLIAKLETVEVWMAFFRDSENNLMGIMAEIPRT